MVRVHESQVGGREFVLDRDGDVFRLRANALHARHQVVVIQVQALCDRPQVLVLGGFARQQQAERGVIVHNHAPVAIQNAPARPGNRHRFDAVLLRPLTVEFGILYLQPPEAGNQEQKDNDGGVLENGNLTRRKPRIIAQRRFIGKLLLEIWVGRRNDHNEAWLRSIPILAVA